MTTTTSTAKTDDWIALGPDVETIRARCPRPLEALARGDVPALVIRRAYPVEACRRSVQRLFDEQLLYNPERPVPEKFLAAGIPEGYYREGRGGGADALFARRQAKEQQAGGRRRIDIGTSLGYRGSDPEAFFAHSAETHSLFAKLFPDDHDDDPIRICYDTLERLADAHQRVVTAYEPDGRRYGPAIIRAHYGGYTYAPHFDSVRLREKRADYAVHRFAHQFAGVLVLQNTQLGDRSAQCVVHRCLWRPEIDPYLRDGTFHRYAEREKIANVEVALEPGDLYFFNTRSIHEVPGVNGRHPRIVLGTFIGYGPDEDEIMVWS